MEITHVIPLTASMGSIVFRNENSKSLDRFELIAFINDVAVEMIAANTAHPTKAVIHGVVVSAIAAINTLPPWGISIPVDLAKDPKNTGTMQTIIVMTPAMKEALETILGEAPAKQRCPISCSITINNKGINNHPHNLEETLEKFSTVGILIAVTDGSDIKTNTKHTRNTQVKNPACTTSVEMTAFNPP